jgi:hypothetical protein
VAVHYSVLLISLLPAIFANSTIVPPQLLVDVTLQPVHFTTEHLTLILVLSCGLETSLDGIPSCLRLHP